MRCALLGPTCALLMSESVAAQNRMRGQGTVRGIAYDSLSHTPLAGADVWVQGSSTRTRTDSAGHFRFETLLDGPYVILLSHEGLDSVGVYQLAANVTVETGRVATVFLTTPSLRTVWLRRCGATQQAAADSGVLIGLVTDAQTSNRLAGAAVVASWLAITQQGDDVATEQRSLVTITDSIGWYYGCGLSTEVTLQVRAFGTGDSTGAILVRPSARGLARRDFVVGRGRSAAIRGTVFGLDGPLGNARVAVDSHETSTGADGSFVLGNLPSGTQWLTVRAVGREPQEQSVALLPGDTLRLELRVGAAAVLLDTVQIVGTRRFRAMQGFEDRRRRGFGTFRTEADFRGRHDVISTFYAIPSLRVVRQRGSVFLVFPGRSMGSLGGCLAAVYLDGFRIGHDELLAYSPEELLAIEVFHNGNQAPLQYATTSGCGIVLVWTKFMR